MLSGGARGSGVNKTSWFCTPFTPHQLARLVSAPYHFLLIPQVTGHRTFLLTSPMGMDQLGVLQNRVPQLLSAV